MNYSILPLARSSRPIDQPDRAVGGQQPDTQAALEHRQPEATGARGHEQQLLDQPERRDRRVDAAAGVERERKRTGVHSTDHWRVAVAGVAEAGREPVAGAARVHWPMRDARGVDAEPQRPQRVARVHRSAATTADLDGGRELFANAAQRAEQLHELSNPVGARQPADGVAAGHWPPGQLAGHQYCKQLCDASARVAAEPAEPVRPLDQRQPKQAACAAAEGVRGQREHSADLLHAAADGGQCEATAAADSNGIR